MTKAKKTIRTAALIALANDFMASSPDSARMDRLAVADFMRNVLLEAGAYAGFNYLRDYHDPASDSSRVVFFDRT